MLCTHESVKFEINYLLFALAGVYIYVPEK